MSKSIKLTASIVLYKENISEVISTIQCFLELPITKKLFLIDNTKSSNYFGKLETKDIKYIANQKNIGFGAGHNKIINEIKYLSDYHLILNPDVTFEQEDIIDLINQIEKDKDVIMIAPKVVFPDGKHQYSCRRYPSIKELFFRRFNFLKKSYKKTVEIGEYKDVDISKPFYPEYITGCFHLYNTDAFIKMNGFDERYFLYMEDVDICRKIDSLNKKKLYYPKGEITHVLKQGSSKKTKLLFYHVSSAIKYFLKWGF